MALTGGGLLEAELKALAASLVQHGVENAELGPLAFELSTVAAEKAQEMLEARCEAVDRKKEKAKRAQLRAAQRAKKAQSCRLEP